MNLTEKDREILKALVVLSVALIVASIFMPSMNVYGVGRLMGLKAFTTEYASLEKDLKVIEKEVKEKRDKLSKKEQIMSRVGELEKSIQYYEKRLPNSERLDDLMAELNDLARIAGQNYVSMMTLKPTPKGTYIELPLQMNLVTDYHGLGSFINMTENSERFSKVDDFSIVGDPEVPGRVSVQLTLSTFKFAPEAEQEENGDTTAAKKGQNKKG